MAWGYLARAWAIDEYAYYRQIQESDTNEDGISLDEFSEVAYTIRTILAMAEDSCITARETPYEYKTIRQCKKWLKDFGGR